MLPSRPFFNTDSPRHKKKRKRRCRRAICVTKIIIAASRPSTQDKQVVRWRTKRLGSVGLGRGRWRAKLKRRLAAKEKGRSDEKAGPRALGFGAAAMLTRQRFGRVRSMVGKVSSDYQTVMPTAIIQRHLLLSDPKPLGWGGGSLVAGVAVSWRKGCLRDSSLCVLLDHSTACSER